MRVDSEVRVECKYEIYVKIYIKSTERIINNLSDVNDRVFFVVIQLFSAIFPE